MMVQDLVCGIWDTERIKKTEEQAEKTEEKKEPKVYRCKVQSGPASAPRNPLKLLLEVAGVGASRRDAGSGFFLGKHSDPDWSLCRIAVVCQMEMRCLMLAGRIKRRV
jgi:hypothetical protein